MASKEGLFECNLKIWKMGGSFLAILILLKPLEYNHFFLVGCFLLVGACHGIEF